MPAKPPPPSADSFHRERSKLLDGFALVEARLVEAIVRGGGKAKGDTFASKLKTFRDQRAKVTDELLACLVRLQDLNAIRTDVVHSTLGIMDQDGERYAVFSNARAAAEKVQPATRLTYRSLRETTAELIRTAELIASA